MDILLEFSEEQNQFHSNCEGVQSNTNGYKPLGYVNWEHSQDFTAFIRDKYGAPAGVTFNLIKHEFDLFFKNLYN